MDALSRNNAYPPHAALDAWGTPLSRSHLALLLAALALAGCLGAGATVRPASTGAALLGADGMPLPPLALAGSSCTWGGGHSVHTFQFAGQIIPEPWKAADVMDDIGPQLSYSDPGEQIYGIPSTGWGNWHTNLVCKAWTLDNKTTPLTFGMVLTRVEPPTFDASPVHRNYIVNVIASDNAALNMRLMMDGWMSMPATGQVSWDDGVFHHVLATQMHGTYESLFRTRDAGALQDDIVRLWFQKANEDKTFSPVSIDMRIAGAGGKPPAHVIADPDGYFSHTNTEDHAFVAGQPSGVAGQIAGFVVTGFDASFSWGPAPPVKLEKEYAHL